MQDKIKQIQNILDENTAAIIMSDANRFYLTGFKSSAGYVVITKKDAVLLIDFRYFEKAKQTVKNLCLLLAEKPLMQIKGIISGCEEIYIETDYVSLDMKNRLEKELEITVRNEDTLTKKIYGMRAVKNDVEIKNIKNAQKLTDEAFSYILPKITQGVTEKEIALDMEFFMRQRGSEGVAFDFIVVSGKNSSLPHGVPTDKKIEVGDFVTMDFGAVINGYRSDMTRTVAVGRVTDEQRKVYNTVLKAQQAAIGAAAAGKICMDIDKTARDIIDKEYKGCFGHGLGHSVGIDIHESPSFNTVDKTILKSGMVITVEPGIYLENKFGVRIEDMIIITDNGNINITESPKNLIIV